MSGAICGRSPYVWSRERETARWCFGCRRRLEGTWERCAGWPYGTIPDGSVGYWEPVWSYRCDGCGRDRRVLG